MMFNLISYSLFRDISDNYLLTANFDFRFNWEYVLISFAEIFSNLKMIIRYSNYNKAIPLKRAKISTPTLE